MGTTIEWYDFFVYGLAAALVFGELFFPKFDPVVGTLSAFATFAVGFLARPLGGIVFSHFGDRRGRKSALVGSLLLMGTATVLVGVLPSYDSIGGLAPVVLVLLRFCQGFAVGGEWGGAVLMAVEHSESQRRGLAGSFPQMGVPAGLILASGAFIALAPLSDAQFAAWGWRLPFLASGVLVVAGLMIRLTVAESPEFEKLRAAGGPVKNPVFAAVRNNPKNILLAAAMRQETTIFYMVVTFAVSYGTEQVGVTRDVMLNGTLLAALAALFTLPLFGALSDRFGRRTLFRIGAAAAVVFALPFFALLDTGQPVLIYLALIIGLAVVHALMYGPEAAFFSELFGAEVRYSGASLGYQLGSVVGGLAPLVGASLLLAGDGSPIYVILYVAGLQVITFIGATLAPDTRRSASSFSTDQQLETTVADKTGPAFT
ncbi:MFS transporter [Kribbella sancticallisti]|uniref:MFS transporter n=1 Tax=Kribbella sancticallisti TaxID=460087 RepID=UPI0031D4E2A8